MRENACGKLPTSRFASTSYSSLRKSHIVPKGQEPFEEGARVVDSPEQRVCVAEPKAAREKCSFASRQTVDILARTRRVAVHEREAHQLLLDRRDRSTNARIIGGKEADLRDQEEAGVKLSPPIRLDEGLSLRIEAPFEHFGMNALAQLTPSINGPAQGSPLDQLHGSVEDDPCHDPRLGEVPGIATNLPHAVIR